MNVTLSSMNAGSDVGVQLAGPDLDRLRAAAEDVTERLREYSGVYEVTDSFRAGKEEMKLGMKPAAEALGLTCRTSADRCARRSTARRRNASSAPGSSARG